MGLRTDKTSGLIHLATPMPCAPSIRMRNQPTKFSNLSIRQPNKHPEHRARFPRQRHRRHNPLPLGQPTNAHSRHRLSMGQLSPARHGCTRRHHNLFVRTLGGPFGRDIIFWQRKRLLKSRAGDRSKSTRIIPNLPQSDTCIPSPFWRPVSRPKAVMFQWLPHSPPVSRL